MRVLSTGFNLDLQEDQFLAQVLAHIEVNRWEQMESHHSTANDTITIYIGRENPTFHLSNNNFEKVVSLTAVQLHCPFEHHLMHFTGKQWDDVAVESFFMARDMLRSYMDIKQDEGTWNDTGVSFKIAFVDWEDWHVSPEVIFQPMIRKLQFGKITHDPYEALGGHVGMQFVEWDDWVQEVCWLPGKEYHNYNLVEPIFQRRLLDGFAV